MKDIWIFIIAVALIAAILGFIASITDAQEAPEQPQEAPLGAAPTYDQACVDILEADQTAIHTPEEFKEAVACARKLVKDFAPGGNFIIKENNGKVKLPNGQISFKDIVKYHIQATKNVFVEDGTPKKNILENHTLEEVKQAANL